jgi:hypothetical protein
MRDRRESGMFLTGTVADGFEERIAHARQNSAGSRPTELRTVVYFDTVSYFSFTKRRTKIAQTPTVTGN